MLQPSSIVQQPASSPKAKGTSPPNIVSTEADRGDSTKVTMQTRVAVRDKTPHRFQVVPLREVLKVPSKSTGNTTMRPMKASRSSSSSRARKFSVHLDEPTKGDVPRSLGNSSGKLVLQDKDLNREPISDIKHRRTGSLEFGALQDSGSTEALSGGPATKPFVPAHSYSQSLTQYSFRLKPWRSYTQIRGSAVERNSPIGNAEDLDNPSLSHNIKITVDSPPRDPAANPPDTFPELTSEFRTRAKTVSHNNPIGRLMDSNKSLHGNGNFRTLESIQQPSDLDSRKRHAIYADSDFLPLVTSTDIFTGPLKPEEAFQFSTLKRSGDSLQFVAPHIQVSGISSPAPPPSIHSSTGPKTENPLPLLPPSGTSQQPSNLVFPPTRPLNLVRNVMARSNYFPPGQFEYPKIVLQLMQDLDEAIESWNSSGL